MKFAQEILVILMAVSLLVGAILAAILGGLILASAASALHEIEAFILFMIAAIFWSSACVVAMLDTLSKKLDGLLKRPGGS